MRITQVKTERIEIIDGFRAVAIALVICFHYFSRWTPPHNPDNLYPYGSWLAAVPLFHYGGLGVYLFFIVSGFVISLTLTGCRDWLDFVWKRFARLFPAMFLCSVITFAVINTVAAGPFSASARDFLPSLTFTEPYVWTRVFGIPFKEIDGAYWSLQVEVKFYFWACLVFFMGGPSSFGPRFLVMFNAALLSTALGHFLNWHLLELIFGFLLFPRDLPWFAAGVGFYCIYRRPGDLAGLLLIAESAALLVVRSIVATGVTVELLFTAIFYALFVIFIFRPGWLAWLSAKPVVAIGAASYSIYLLHQNIGVTLLWMWLQGTSGSDAHLSVLVAAAVAAIITLTSLVIFRFWEMPAKRLVLRSRLRAISQSLIESTGQVNPIKK